MSGGRITLAIYIAIGFIPVVFGPAAGGPIGPSPDVVVIRYGRGGNLAEHTKLFASYRARDISVEIRGPCYSACTALTHYLGHDRLCIAEGAFMAFHAVRSLETGARMDDATGRMYYSFPPEIQRWIDRNGGHQNLPLHGFWTMYDRELWAMGYPKCQ